MFIGGRHGFMAGRSGLRVQDVFATSLWSGNNTSQTITTGIDLAGKGGLVISKTRQDSAAAGQYGMWADTARGASLVLMSSSTSAEFTDNPAEFTSFGSSGFSISSSPAVNADTDDYVGWSFAKKAKFFDVVTYTGDGFDARTITHSLGVTPGMVIVKRRGSAGNWIVWHAGTAAAKMLWLNSTGGQQNDSTGNAFGNGNGTYVAPTSTSVMVGYGPLMNASGSPYIMYLFAHDPDTTNGIIQCGGFTHQASGMTSINLGWEPSWVMLKSTSTGDWLVFDMARGLSRTGGGAVLTLNSTAAETNNYSGVFSTAATGFQSGQNASTTTTWIYMAIRKGPM